MGKNLKKTIGSIFTDLWILTVASAAGICTLPYEDVDRFFYRLLGSEPSCQETPRPIISPYNGLDKVKYEIKMGNGDIEYKTIYEICEDVQREQESQLERELNSFNDNFE